MAVAQFGQNFVLLREVRLDTILEESRVQLCGLAVQLEVVLAFKNSDSRFANVQVVRLLEIDIFKVDYLGVVSEYTLLEQMR